MTQRLCFALLAAALWAAPASATNLHVSPSGLGAACTPGSPCALSQANTMAQPGDVIHMADGTYNTAPMPGRSGTASARIEYRGNPNNKKAVVVPGFTNTSREYLTWRYFRTTGPLRISPNCSATTGCGGDPNPFRNIRVIGVTIGTGFWLSGTSYSKIDSCEVAPNGVDQGYFWLAPMDGDLGAARELTTGDTISNNKITLNTGAQEKAFQHGTGVLFAIQGDANMQVRKCLFERNNISIVFRKNAAPDAQEPTRGVRGAYLYAAVEDTFRYNKWTVIDSTDSSYPVSCGQRISFRFRTQSARNYFYRDSLIIGGRCGWVTLSSQSETNQPCVVGDQRWDECYFKSTANGGGFIPFDFQFGLCRDTIQRSVFVTNIGGNGSTALGTQQVHQGPVLIDHNTFYATSSNGYPLLIDPTGSFGNWASGAELIVTNNIFYMPNGSSGSGAGALYRLWSGRPFTANNNLYADYGRISSMGDRSIQFATGCTGPSGAGCSSLRTSVPGTGGTFHQATGQDGSSFYASPAFLDSSFANFNPGLSASSAARGRGTLGSDVGAMPFGGGGPDVTPPAAITNLASTAVSDQTLILTWTAPGDDGLSGIATGYDLRMSTQPIDAGNFGSATPVPGVSAPQPPGTPQSVVAVGLTPGTMHYFAIRARDEAGNWSPLGFHSVTTSATDGIQPAAVQDLSAGP